MSVAFHDIDHSYGAVPVLEAVNLSAAAGEVLCLLGPSGSGKTTLLRLAAGLERVQRGRIQIDERIVADAQQHCAPEHRGVGLVFQEHVLYPHLSVHDNIGFGLATLPSETREARIADQLAAVDLVGFGQRYPHTLSGGQQQRVALARSLAPRPKVLLMDEPFASVDSNLRRRLRAQTRRVLKQQQTTTVIVTHDAEEALALADRMAVLEGGRLLQAGTPAQLWEQPARVSVATLLLGGDPVPVDVSQSGIQCAYGTLPLDRFLDLRTTPETGPAALVLRPGQVRLVPSAEAPAVIADRRFAGTVEQVVLQSTATPAAAPLTLELQAGGLPPVGSGVRFEWAPDAGLLYDPPRAWSQGQPTAS